MVIQDVCVLTDEGVGGWCVQVFAVFMQLSDLEKSLCSVSINKMEICNKHAILSPE